MVTIIKPNATTNWNKKSSREVTVVTHNGVFHSDEIFSVALLRFFYKNINVIRTRDIKILKKAINIPEVFVLDVGGEYNPTKRNFDHHQQNVPELMSTVSLLFIYLFPDFKNDELLKKLYYGLIRLINNWDIGKTDIPKKNAEFFLPAIISGFNRYGTPEQDNQFLKAVDFAYTILANKLHSLKEYMRSKEIWRKKKILYKNTILLNEPCAFWRTIQGNNPQYKYIVQPGENTWNLLTVDNKLYPLPIISKKEKGVVFQHKERFIIVFDNLNSTMNFLNKRFSNHQK